MADPYELEARLARAALGAPWLAALAYRDNAFTDRCENEVWTAVLAASVLWDRDADRLELPALMVDVSKRSLQIAELWSDDDRTIRPVWTSPLWGRVELAAGVAAMRDGTAAIFAWQDAFNGWRQCRGKGA